MEEEHMSETTERLREAEAALRTAADMSEKVDEVRSSTMAKALIVGLIGAIVAAIVIAVSGD
ncbi:MAG: hypothetical protein R3290_08175 [Acidimicrobiia bacterium]|nr:hypothetical protein [Acidimicrobiia bacterium]